MFETIVAPITGAPPAAIAVIRISGPEAWRVAAEVFQPWPDEARSRVAFYGHWVHGDDGIALPFTAQSGYTGEEAVEISLHGSAASIRLAIQACLLSGARMARPGEFTERAFLNGRMDLTQAEAVRDTIEAVTEVQLREANRARDGQLYRTASDLRNRAVGVRAAIEASVDFSEEIGELDTLLVESDLADLSEQVDRLLATADVGRILREGLRVAIVGPPNAGKSSLLNALLGTERAIVTPIPGTTRDYIEERADFRGYPVVLIDTAGLRDTEDPVEAIGVQRSRALAASADLIWFVYDATEPIPEVPNFGRPTRVIPNKIDLLPDQAGVSTTTRQGLDELVTWTLEAFDIPREPLVTARVADLLRKAKDQVVQCRHHVRSNAPDDLLSVLIQELIDTLGEITGETASEDMVSRIFHDFCVGK